MTGVGSFEGRTALVTGGAAGIGRAICETIVDRSGSVVVADIDGSAAAETAKEIGERALGVRCDVTNSSDVENAIAAAKSEFGSLEVLVNNAGITRDGMLHKLSEEDWDVVLDVHLKGSFLCTQAFARYRRELVGADVSGSIVNISSINAKAGNIGQINYVAAKAGLVGMTKTAARELARYAVRVNAVQPGFIDTAMTRVIPEELRKQRIAEIPLGRAGTVWDVAKAVAFLASDEAAYLTGVVLEVTGGRLM